MTDLPPALASYVDIISANIRQASPLSREATRRNCPAHIAAVDEIAAGSDDRVSASERLIESVDALCDELARHPLNDAQRVDRLREAALDSHRVWAEKLQTAKPNDMARSLGLDW